MPIQALREFNRFELKYLLSRSQAEALKMHLCAFMEKDEHGKIGSYTLKSLYFDSDDFRCYWEKIEGIKFRRKLRIRHYSDDGPLTGDSIVFLEIKQRLDRVTQKRRVPMRYRDALNFCERHIVPEHEPRDHAVIEEAESMLILGNLQPQIITTYSREAYVGSDYDAGLRITFDSDVTYSRKNLDLAENPKEGFMISPDMVVMEIKTNDRIPYWITELVAAYNHRLIRVSKYCQGLECASVTPSSFFHLET
ncbi:MAG: polyphosphate polymerase domain-containing protein [Patescibacteria group bacterium]